MMMHLLGSLLTLWITLAAPAPQLAPVTFGTPALTSSTNPSLYGQPVTFTANILGADSSGRVTFYDGPTVLGSVPVVSGAAAITAPLTHTGTRTIKAFYLSSTSSGSTTITQTVNASPVVTNGLIPGATIATGNGPVAAALGDFDGDGKIDVAVVSKTDSTVTIYKGDGAGSFAILGTPIAVNATPVSIVAADFNRDGNIDLAVINAGTLTILTGDGHGGFTSSSQTFSFLMNARQLAAGDFDGDGKIDLVFAADDNSSGSNIFFGNGDGTFHGVVNYNLLSTWSVAVGDLNGDGALDILTTGQVGVFSFQNGDGAGNFPSFSGFGQLGSSAQPRAATLADLDGDGSDDILIAIPNFNSVDIIMRNSQSVTTGAGPISIATADFNGDGQLDFVTANSAAASVTLALNNNKAASFTTSNYPVGTTPVFVLTGDFNSDGRPDVLVLNSASNNMSVLLGGFLTSDMTITTSATDTFLQGASGQHYKMTAVNSGPVATVGTVTVTDTLPAGLTATAMAGSGWSCDISTPSAPFCTSSSVVAAGASFPQITLTVAVASNVAAQVTNSVSVSGGGETNTTNNTATDLTTITPSSTVRVDSSPNPSLYGASVTLTATVVPAESGRRVSFYSGTLLLGSANTDASGLAQITTQSLVPGTNTLRGSCVADVTYQACGYVASLVPHVVSVGRSNGLAPALTVTDPSLSGPTAVATGDFDRDGKLDLVVANGSGNLLIFRGNGAGGFTLSQTVPSVPTPRALAVGDFDGDGKLDIAVAYSSSSARIFLGDGAGNFTAKPALTTGSTPISIALADFNADGKLDMAVANNGGNVSVFIGNGDGTFAAPVNYSVGGAPTGIVAADLNNDGRVDLAVSNFSLSQAQILIGSGTGTFTTNSVVASQGTFPHGIAAGDFDGNGATDLVTATLGSAGGGKSANVYFNTGNANFPTSSEARFTTPTGTYAVGVVDLNGDGFLDIVTTNSTSGSMSVLYGNGSGGFATHVDYATGVSPQSLAFGDFNGDGVVDIAVANAASTTVTIFPGAPIVQLTLGNLNATYTGSPIAVTVSSVPALTPADVSITYNGSSTVPTDAGSYTVVATVINPNYSGSVTGTLVITLPVTVITPTGALDVTSQTSVTFSSTSFNRVTGVYSTTLIVKNVGSTLIAAPLQVVLTGLPANATITNATGTTTGTLYPGVPYITAPGASTLAPGASVSVPMTYKNPAGSTLTGVAVKVLSGTF